MGVSGDRGAAARAKSNSVRSEDRREGLAWARAWRERMKPVFDRMAEQAMFAPEDLR